MESSEQKRECKPPPKEPLRPDPLNWRPAPRAGQKWSLADMQNRAVEAFNDVNAGNKCYYTAESDDWFHVLLGNYPPDGGAGKSTIPALQNLGLYFWYIPPWYDDDQTPHKEDEAYFVIDGRGRLCVSGKTQEVSKGDLVFVPRSAPHKFFTPYGEGLTLLIIFSPAYTGGEKPNPADEPCRDPGYENKSKDYVKELMVNYCNKNPPTI